MKEATQHPLHTPHFCHPLLGCTGHSGLFGVITDGKPLLLHRFSSELRLCNFSQVCLFPPVFFSNVSCRPQWFPWVRLKGDSALRESHGFILSHSFWLDFTDAYELQLQLWKHCSGDETKKKQEQISQHKIWWNREESIWTCETANNQKKG